MNRCANWSRIIGLAAIASLTALVTGCPLVTSDDFVSISEHGFDAVDNARDDNAYPWAMEYFTADGADPGDGFLYVGTGNRVINAAAARFGVLLDDTPLFRPPEIRRYRPDLGPGQWEKVLDYRDVETDPDWKTSGFRGMAAYRARSDGVTYLYAGTFGDEPAVWRSPTGEAGSWEQVFTSPLEGSIRSFAVHNNLLYVAVSHESGAERFPGEIYATDGDTFTLVNDDGFGNPLNWGVFSLRSYNGWLYAGTYNREEGCEVWKLEGPGGAGPVSVYTKGGPQRSNHSTTEMVVFDGRLYVPMLVYVGYNVGGFPPFKGADMVRLDADDNMETIVGPNSLSGFRSGFGDFSNAYLWSLTEHNGKLYCGTWDSASLVSFGSQHVGDLLGAIPQLIKNLTAAKPRASAFDNLFSVGAELYASSDGVNWSPIFTNGLGNPDNYGVRNMVSGNGTLYIGLANPTDGLEVFEYVEP